MPYQTKFLPTPTQKSKIETYADSSEEISTDSINQSDK